MSETAGCIARCITVIIRRGVRSILRSSGRGKGEGGGGGVLCVQEGFTSVAVQHQLFSR